MTNPATDNIQRAIGPSREQITGHKVYASIQDLSDLRIFMQYHVYAVWDFMSLLKSLQIGLTCTSVPWFPVGSAEVRSLINEIVAGEESDIDANGTKKSHFEMYLDAMVQCGADTSGIEIFISELKGSGDFDFAYAKADTPGQARSFVDFTFEVIHSQCPHLQASAFTFGREDLIPEMFHKIVGDLNKKFPGEISLFKYYLDRHIEVDGDHHSHLAIEMVSQLCGSDPELIDSAQKAAISALEKRIALWDGAYDAILASRQH